MTMQDDAVRTGRQGEFIQSLADFTRDHKAVHWSGTLSQFFERVLSSDPKGAARTSHQYMWDMIRWMGGEDGDGNFHCRLFDQELFGVDEAIDRVVDYFKAAAAGSEVGRRLLLLLGPPSGGQRRGEHHHRYAVGAQPRQHPVEVGVHVGVVSVGFVDHHDFAGEGEVAQGQVAAFQASE